MASPTEIEKKSLEAHVELCAERYATLENKLTRLETRMDKLEGYLIEIKDVIIKSSAPAPAVKGEDANPYKTMIAIGTTIIGVLITGVITLLVKLS